MENFEKIEAYLKNELSDSEKNDFLNEIESNSGLKSEFDFQKEVINGIQDARKAELKAMLAKIPIVSTGTGSALLYKILAGGAATLLIGTSLWYYSNSSIKTTTLQENEIIAQNPDLKIEPSHSQEESITELNKETKLKEKREIKKNNKTIARSPQIITPNLPNNDYALENEVLPEENLAIPDAINNGTINLSSKINVEVKLKKKYGFHYQYSHEGIILYGEFEEGLFEILELNKEKGVEIYLYYESNYYYINNNSGAITPLKPVANKNIKNNLKGLR